MSQPTTSILDALKNCEAMMSAIECGHEKPVGFGIVLDEARAAIRNPEIEASMHLRKAMDAAIRNEMASSFKNPKLLLHAVAGWMSNHDLEFSAKLKAFLEGCQ